MVKECKPRTYIRFYFEMGGDWWCVSDWRKCNPKIEECSQSFSASGKKREWHAKAFARARRSSFLTFSLPLPTSPDFSNPVYISRHSKRDGNYCRS